MGRGGDEVLHRWGQGLPHHLRHRHGRLLRRGLELHPPGGGTVGRADLLHPVSGVPLLLPPRPGGAQRLPQRRLPAHAGLLPLAHFRSHPLLPGPAGDFAADRGVPRGDVRAPGRRVLGGLLVPVRAPRGLPRPAPRPPPAGRDRAGKNREEARLAPQAGKIRPRPDGPGKSLWATPAGAVGTAGQENPSAAGQARKIRPWPDRPGKSLWATPAGAVGTAGQENPSVAGRARKTPLHFVRRGGWHRRPGKSVRGRTGQENPSGLRPPGF